MSKIPLTLSPSKSEPPGSGMRDGKMDEQHVSNRERVASTSDVPVGEVRVVQCGARSLALSNVDGELYAIDNVCTHDGGPLGEGRLSRGRVICPRHGAAFDARTGRVLSLPAVRSVSAYRVIVEGDDVYVECDD